MLLLRAISVYIDLFIIHLTVLSFTSQLMATAAVEPRYTVTSGHDFRILKENLGERMQTD